MAAPRSVRPLDDPWVAALHRSEHDDEPIGSGVLIDGRRVLTCAHVVLPAEGTLRPEALPPLWVAFPKSDSDERRPVVRITVPERPSRDDVAVLHLAAPVQPARLRRPG